MAERQRSFSLARCRRTPFLKVFLVAVLIALLPVATEAHRLNIFASNEGTIIRGSVYFQGMRAARTAPIRVLDPAGALLANVVTNEAGAFTFQVTRRVAHHFVADLGDGHRAEFIVSAEQLPPFLPAPSLPEPAEPVVGTTSEGTKAVMPADVAQEAIETIVENTVARHVGPLRQQIAAYEDRIRWHDVLGGIGYIVGMTGVACYFLARRRSDPTENHRKN